MDILIEEHHTMHNSLNTLRTGTFEPKAQIPGFIHGDLAIDNAGKSAEVVCCFNGAYYTIYSVDGVLIDRETVWEDYGTYLKVHTFTIGDHVYSISFRESKTSLEKETLEELAAISGTQVFACSINDDVRTRLQDAYSECLLFADESVLNRMLARQKELICSAKENLDRLQKLAVKLGVRLGPNTELE